MINDTGTELFYASIAAHLEWQAAMDVWAAEPFMSPRYLSAMKYSRSAEKAATQCHNEYKEHLAWQEWCDQWARKACAHRWINEAKGTEK